MFKYTSDNITFYVKRIQDKINFLIGEDADRKEIKDTELASKLGKSFPLYHLDEIIERKRETVFFCDTEENADILSNAGYLATTYCHEKTDLEPLKSRKILIAPSENQPFYETMLKKHFEKIYVFPNDFLLNEIQPEDLKAYVESKRNDRLVKISLVDLLAWEAPPRRFILHPFFPEKENALLFAATGVGKTHLAEVIAYACATKTTVFKCWRPEDFIKVLYIDAEMDQTEIQRRMQIIKNSFPAAEGLGNLQFITQKLQTNRPNTFMPDIFTDEGRHEVEDSLDQDTKLLILDNLSTLYGGDENSNTDWYPVQKWLVQIKSQGVNVLIVHHSGKDPSKESFRGASRIADIVCEVLALTHPIGYRKKEGVRANVSYRKGRNVFGEDAEGFQIFCKEEQVQVGYHYIKQELWGSRTAAEARLHDLKAFDELLASVEARLQEGTHWTEVCGDFELSFDELHKICKDLQKLQFITKRKGF